MQLPETQKDTKLLMLREICRNVNVAPIVGPDKSDGRLAVMPIEDTGHSIGPKLEFSLGFLSQFVFV
jgi:hypothetical protein